MVKGKYQCPICKGKFSLGRRSKNYQTIYKVNGQGICKNCAIKTGRFRR